MFANVGQRASKCVALLGHFHRQRAGSTEFGLTVSKPTLGLVDAFGRFGGGRAVRRSNRRPFLRQTVPRLVQFLFDKPYLLSPIAYTILGEIILGSLYDHANLLQDIIPVIAQLQQTKSQCLQSLNISNVTSRHDP